MLLAFAAKPEELDILMLSLTFGNVEVQKYVPDVSDISLMQPVFVTQAFHYTPCRTMIFLRAWILIRRLL
jgi:hypothetical protein